MIALADGEVEAFLEVEAAVLFDFGGEHAFVLLQQFTPATVLHQAEEEAIAGHAVGGEPEFVERVRGGLLILG